ncbi:MAG: hypothetical protein E6J26_05095, partial [Chloroflexi bacterium]
MLKLNRPASLPIGVSLTLINPTGEVTRFHFALTQGEQELTSALSIPAPILWDTRSPQLYDLTAELVHAPTP